MKYPDRFQGKPRILDYRQDPDSEFVAFPISRRSRGIDVFATLLYLEPNSNEVHGHIGRILTHAVDVLGLMNGRHLPIPRSTIQVDEQVSLVEHVHFGPKTTVNDIELALELSGSTNMQYDKARLTSALIDTGGLAGFVIEVAQRNEIITATDEEVQQALRKMTDEHYGL